MQEMNISNLMMAIDPSNFLKIDNTKTGVVHLPLPQSHDDVLRALKRLVTEIRDDASLIESIAKSSYFHDNGFAKIVLKQSDSFPNEIRLHLWHPNVPTYLPEGTMGNIHNHSSEFHSMVLFGEALEEIFEETKEANEQTFDVTKYSCGSRGENSEYSMIKKYNCQLKLIDKINLKPGDFHALNFSVLHKIAPRSNELATLFIQGSRKQTGTIAYCNEEKVQKSIMPSQPMSTGELTFQLNWFLQQL